MSRAVELPQVLSTLNEDGSRRWIRPRLSRGRFLRARQVVGYALIVIFAVIPAVRIGGRPLLLLDVAHREFSILGATFYPTDTRILALFLVATLIGIFLFTALLGRVWCGWACPQTVYMELVYRPLERWFDGTAGRGGKAGRRRGLARSIGLYAAYFAVSFVLAHIFLAYFVNLDDLVSWVRRSPLEHPGSFLVVWVTIGLMMFNFSVFREQTCLVACPYGRLQSVLLDRDSLVISYDAVRGEPRGKKRETRSERSAEDVPESDLISRSSPVPPGDCVDCHLCVITCPTGIDIRDGLQMECVGCTQCIDACDAVMDKIGRPRGLIRYTSRTRLAGAKGRLLRPRVVLYGAAIALLAAALGYALWTRGPADIRIARGRGLPYMPLDGGVTGNPVQIKITNRTHTRAEYRIAVGGAPGVRVVGDPSPVAVEPGQTIAAGFIVALPAGGFRLGRASIHFDIRDDAGAVAERIPFEMIGGWSTSAPVSKPAATGAAP